MPPPTRTRVDPQVRRRQILDEAIALIGRLGYQGFTIQELARRCGLTNGGLLHHFGSKEGLLVAILEERDRREATIIPAAVTFEGGASDEREYSAATVLSVLRAIMTRSTAQPELIRLHTVLQAEALDPAHPAHDHFVRREAMVLDEFTHLLTGHVEDPRPAARAVLALMNGLDQQWLRSGRAFDLVAAWDQAAALLLPWASAAREDDRKGASDAA